MYNEDDTPESLINWARKKSLKYDRKAVLHLYKCALHSYPECFINRKDRIFYIAILVEEGKIYQACFNHVEAIECFTSAIKLDPSLAIEAFRLRSVSYKAIGNLEAADIDIKMLVPLAGAEVLVESARKKHKNGQCHDGLNDYEAAKQLNPGIYYFFDKKYFSLLYEMGLIYQEQANHEQAIECFTILIDKDSGERNAFKLRAISYEAIGNYQAANKDKAEMRRLARYSGISDNEFTLGDRILGRGNAGIVYDGFFGTTPVAIKKPLYTSQECIQRFRVEIKYHRSLSHPNIVELLAVNKTESRNIFLVLEFMMHGSLCNVLENSTIDLPWTMRLSIAIDITNGLIYLHEQGILHRSIKSPNVLLNDRMQAKISDFGRAIKLYKSTTIESIGNWRWAAPEILSGCENTKQTECYSVGSVFWEIASRKMPFKSLSSRTQNSLIRKGKREEIPPQTPAKFASIITACWMHDPDMRPSAPRILEALSDVEIINDVSCLTTENTEFNSVRLIKDKNTSVEMKAGGLKLFSGSAHFWANGNQDSQLRSNVVPYYAETLRIMGPK